VDGPTQSFHSEPVSLHEVTPELARHIRELAVREGITANEATLLLLKRGVDALESEQPSGIGDAFDRFIGSWSRNEEAELLESIDACEAVDEALRK
jgi:hypothetical protein